MKSILKNWGIFTILSTSVCALQGQCIIDSIHFELTECNQGEFYVWLDFQWDSTSTSGFNVAGNGIEYGLYEYGALPIKLGPLPGDDETPYEFVVTDKEHPNCSAFIEIGTVSCDSPECFAKELEIEPIECLGTEFYRAKVNFVSQGIEEFDLFANETFIGTFDVGDLPVEIDSFPACGDEYSYASICSSHKDGECCAEVKFESPSCLNPCGFSDLIAKPIECTDSNFYVKMYLEHHQDDLDSFYVEGNGEVHKYFLYEELPIVLGPFSQYTDGIFEFTLIDVGNDECTAETSLANGICPCAIDDLGMEFGECTSDSTAVFELSFFTDQFDSFDIHIEEEYFMTSTTADLPLRLEDFPVGKQEYIKIKISAKNAACEFVKKVEVPHCSDEGCFGEVKVDSVVCDGNVYYAQINFEHAGNHGAYFVVEGKEKNYGKFKYEELPIVIGPLKTNGDGGNKITIADLNSDHCIVTAFVEAIDCGCFLDEMKLDVGACGSDTTYEVLIDFATEADSFMVYANGDLLGNYLGSQLPLTIPNFPASGKEVDLVKICIGDDAGCCVKKEIHAAGCAEEGCLVDLKKEITECDSSGLFYIILDFDHVGAHSETFIVKGNGHELEYRYRDLPVKVGPFEGGNTFYKFEVCDSELTDCHIDLPVGRVVCSEQCNFDEISADVVECLNGDKYLIKIDSVDPTFSGVDLYFNGNPLGFKKTSEFPMEIEVQRGDNVFDELEICVSDNLTCCEVIKIEPPECDSDCQIFDLSVDTTGCQNDSFSVQINFEHKETSGHFSIRGNGVFYGLFNYDQLPVTLGPLTADGTTGYEFVVIDSLFQSCTTAVELGTISCPTVGSDSKLRSLILQASDGKVHLKVPTFIREKTRLQIFDLRGHQITNKLISSNSDPIIMNVPGLYHGMYILHMESSEGEIYNNKFIIH